MPYVTNDGVSIYYETDGMGPPLVLVHGLSDNLRGWHEYGYVDRLRQQFRLILIDARGHGRSDKPSNADAYLLKHRVTDIVAVLDDLALSRVNYFGTSMGGRIGFGLARYAPERLLSLIVNGTVPYPSDLEFFRQIFRQGLLPWLDLLEKMAGPLTFHTRERFLSNDIDALRASVADNTEDLAPLLPEFALPSLLFAGDQDPIYPLMQRCAKELVNGEFFSLAGQNHFQASVRSDLIAPIILAEIVPFLARVNAVAAPVVQA